MPTGADILITQTDMNKTLTTIIALLLSWTPMTANEIVELDFSRLGFSDQQKLATYTKDGVTITGHNGSRTSEPEYYARYGGMVFYGTNYMELSCQGKAIEKIEFTSHSLLPLEQDKIFADAGAIDLDRQGAGAWTNNRPLTQLTITPRATFDNGCCITAMRIHLTDAPAETVTAATPSISPAGGQIFDDTSIAISTDTPGAMIIYTTDGTMPRKGESGTQDYTAPFRIDRSCIVKAVALKDGLEPSSIGGRGFSVPVVKKSIAELLDDAEEGVYYTLATDLTVTYTLGSTCWIKDDTGALSLFGDAITNKRPTNGSILTSVTGRFNLSNLTPELEFINEARLTPIPGDPCAPLELKATEISREHVNHYIVVRNAKVVKTDTYDYKLTDESGTINLRNNYRIAIDQSLLDNAVDVELFPAHYNSELRYYIARITDPNAVPVEPEPDPEPDLPHDGLFDITAWTVSEAKSLGVENFTSNTWVKGYIVGTYPHEMNMFLDPTLGLADATDHGLALADTPDCDDPSACLKVINIQGKVKSDLNLKSNPAMMGRYVALRGMLGSNYATLMMPDDYTFFKPAGIGNVDRDNLDKEARYYTLQGIEVNADRLESGRIYISVCGGKATKIMVR